MRVRFCTSGSSPLGRRTLKDHGRVGYAFPGKPKKPQWLLSEHGIKHIYSVLRWKLRFSSKSIYRLQGSSGTAGFIVVLTVWWDFLSVSVKQLPWCRQGSWLLHGLGADEGGAVLVLHLWGVLLRGGTGLPHRGVQGQSRHKLQTQRFNCRLLKKTLCLSAADAQDGPCDGRRPECEPICGYRTGLRNLGLNVS